MEIYRPSLKAGSRMCNSHAPIQLRDHASTGAPPIPAQETHPVDHSDHSASHKNSSAVLEFPIPMQEAELFPSETAVQGIFPLEFASPADDQETETELPSLASFPQNLFPFEMALLAPEQETSLELFPSDSILQDIFPFEMAQPSPAPDSDTAWFCPEPLPQEIDSSEASATDSGRKANGEQHWSLAVALEALGAEADTLIPALEAFIEKLSLLETPQEVAANEIAPTTPQPEPEAELLSAELVAQIISSPVVALLIPPRETENNQPATETLAQAILFSETMPEIHEQAVVIEEPSARTPVSAMEVPAIETAPELAPQNLETEEIQTEVAPKEIPVTEASAEVAAEVASDVAVEANSTTAQEESKALPGSAVTSTAEYPTPTKPDLFTAARRVPLKISPESRLVALSDPNSLGAEKFRSLVTRLERLHVQADLKSFQVTSSIIHEGKTLVSGNVGVTLARHFGARTLLVEGDLHRPSLGSIFGLHKMRGLSHWWSGWNDDLAPFIYKMGDLPLWFLSAGNPSERPSDILRSPRFVKAFAELTAKFEWTVVDSTPILPIVDVNLWSRLVDGTLLVVREGVTPVKALKQGLRTLDHPNLIGVILNEADATNEVKYAGDYYGTPKRK